MKEFKQNLINSIDPSYLALAAYTTDLNGISYPVTLDMRDLVLETEDQGVTNMCAAYTATSWLESLLWRKTGKPIHYDPIKLYEKAKTLDNMPSQEGTTLDAVLKAIIELGWGDGFSKRDIKVILNKNQLKRAIHRYGTCLIGFNITDKWGDHKDKLVFDEMGGQSLGGHAVICVGYNEHGVLIQNSWGKEWGKYGFACISWRVFDDQFLYGAYFKNCLEDVEN